MEIGTVSLIHLTRASTNRSKVYLLPLAWFIANIIIIFFFFIFVVIVRYEAALLICHIFHVLLNDNNISIGMFSMVIDVLMG